MVGRKFHQRASESYSPKLSREISPSSSAFSLDWDADDEGAMSSADNVPSRPPSASIPDGSHYQRRPTLAEVLSNTANPPWTLSAFMAFLSQNHCLETLEFTMDASRYHRHYDEMIEPGGKNTEGKEYVKMLWKRLLAAYITPNGPREINLPSDVRDGLLSLPNHTTPPSPSLLEPAVKIIYDLMDESVLVPFLNSLAEPRQTLGRQSPWTHLEDEDTEMGSAHANRSPRRPRNRQTSSPPPLDHMTSSMSSAGSAHQSRGGRVNLSLGLGRASRGNVAAGGSAVSGDNLTDDSGSASSPGREPMTPPSTPPTSDLGPGSPRGRSDRAWRKVTGKLGWGKKSSSGTLREDQYPMFEDEGHLL